MGYFTVDRVRWATGILFLAVVAAGSFSLQGCGTGRQSLKTADAPADSLTSKSLMVSEKYLEASKEKILGNFEEARKILEECLKVDPTHHPSWYQMADIGHITGNYHSALVSAGKAVALDPGNGWYKVLQADLFMKLERYSEAAEVFRELNRIWPGKRIWYEGLAKAQTLSGKPLEAVKTYESILALFGFDEEIFFKIIGLYEKMGKPSKAEGKLQQLVKAYPYDIRYLGHLASVYVKHGKEEKAFPLWQEILRIDPANGEVHFELAGYYRRKGDDNKAYDELIKAFATPNLSIDAKIVVLLSYYNLTEEHPAMLPQAYNLLDLTVKNHPENPKGWSMYADFLMRENRYGEAMDLFSKVVTLDSTRYLVWEQLLICANALNNFEVMAKEGERAIAQFPDQALLYLFFGRGLLYGNKPEDALKAFSRGYLFAGFNDTLAVIFLQSVAVSATYAGDLQRGDEYFEKGLAKGNPTSWLLADYMRFIAQSGRKENLQRVLKAAAGKPEGDPWMKLFMLWQQVAEGSPASNLSVVEDLLKNNSSDFYVMEAAMALCSAAGRVEMAETCRQKALASSRGALLIEKK